jgi:hypothetical protein
VADVARAVGVRPGDGGQDMGHGISLLMRRHCFLAPFAGRGGTKPRHETC